MASQPQFSVIKSEGTFVLPLEPTPNHTLPLSWFDRIPIPNTYVAMFFAYKHGDQPAEVIKQALAKTLVPYYPLAGRIVRSEKGEITGVACTGDGVWFDDASADCSLEEVMGLMNLPSSADQLLPSPTNPVGMSIMFQVTQFTCGGFVVGLKYNHIMTDGMGIVQIMKAVAEIARGLKQPVVAPVWLREHIPSPTFVNMTPPPPPEPAIRLATRLEQLVMDVPQDHINHVKAQFTEQTGERCSTFDIVVAQLWQYRARAVGSDAGVNNALGWAANIRSLLSDFLPDEGGYYGNCIFPVTIVADSGKIVEASLAEVVALIKNAKKRLPDRYAKWAMGELHPYATLATIANYDMIVVSDWSRIGFSEIDYGWGGPAYFTPAPMPSELDFPPACVIIKPPTPEEGCRLIIRCVKKEHFETFSNQMTNFSKDAKGAFLT